MLLGQQRRRKMSKAEEKTIKEIIEALANEMFESPKIKITETNESYKIEINYSGAPALNEPVEVCRTLGFVLRAICSRKLEAPFPRIIIDINGCLEKENEKIVERAKNAAELVVKNGQPMTLSPMNASARRLVHQAVAEIGGLVSESQGFGEERRVVIKPLENN